jgi:hypothetical protein
LRFLVYWALRRDELCDVNLCPDSSSDGSRCEKCPLNRLDAAQHSEAGQLLRRALDLRAALHLGVSLPLDDIAADEFFAMLIIEEEQDRLEREQSQSHGR